MRKQISGPFIVSLGFARSVSDNIDGLKLLLLSLSRVAGQ